LSPDRAHGRDVLGHPRAPAGAGHAGHHELAGQPALDDPGDDPPAADLVERCQPPDEHQGRVEQGVDGAGAQPDPLGERGDVGERLDRSKTFA
jgi:hypothetical protein